MSVTCEPKALKTSANSQPTAPAPTMTIDFGAFSRMSASSDEMTVVLFSSRPDLRQALTREPVEMTTAFFASCFSSLPSAVLTATAFLPASVAGALDPRDLVLLEQELDALGVLRADGARALHGDAVVELDVADGDAEVGGVLDAVGERGRLEERLGRECSPRARRCRRGLRARRRRSTGRAGRSGSRRRSRRARRR